MRDFTSGIGDDDIMNARANRSQPDIDPGMEEDDSWDSLGDSDDNWSSSFGGGSSFGGSSLGGRSAFDDFDSPFGGGGLGSRGMGGNMGGGFNNFGNSSGFSTQYGTPNSNAQQNQMQSPEDKFWSTIMAGIKSSFGALKTFVTSFKDFSVLERMFFGRNSFITGITVSGISLLGCILGYKDICLDFLIGGLLATGVSAPIFMFALDDLKKNGVPKQREEAVYAEEEEEDIDIEDIDIDDTDLDDIDLGNDVSDEIWGRTENHILENPFGRFEEEEEDEVKIEPKKDAEETIKDLENQLSSKQLNSKMITKQFLFDIMIGQLENKTPDYARERVLDEDSREFLAYCNMVDEASSVVGGKSGVEAPRVLKITDKIFYTLLEVERPNWIKDKKVDEFCKEIASVCAYDERTQKKDPNVSASGFITGRKMIIKIMKGENALVTLKDVYTSKKVKEEILNGKMKMPIVFGINENGEEVYRDFKDVHALLVSGAPRSGKSWTVKSLIAQLMMFKKPSEFQFYVIDAKTKTSDFFYLTVPHVRDFITEDEKIIELLRWLCNVESKRREDIFQREGNVLNIEDYHKKNPFKEMPYILVVIDEIITISNRMDKETKNEFMGLLKMFTSRLPALGIRVLMVPHVIKNEVIDKTITDMIPYRISVKGDAEAVESVTGARPKDFPIKLANMGDMAIKLGNDGVDYAHSAIISGSNDGFDDFFKFLTDFWLNIEPESFPGSKLENDIRMGYRTADLYSGIKPEYLEAIERDRNAVNKSRVEVVSESQKPKRSVRPKPKVDNSQPIKVRNGEDLMDDIVLDDKEISDMLKGAHNDKSPEFKSRIRYDDGLR